MSHKNRETSVEPPTLLDHQTIAKQAYSGSGLSAEQTQGYLNYTPSVKFTQDGDSYTVTTAIPTTKNETTFKSGVTFEDKVADRACQTTITVDGDTVTRVQKFDDGNSLTIVRQFSGDQMVVSLSTSKWDGVAKRYYKA